MEGGAHAGVCRLGKAMAVTEGVLRGHRFGPSYLAARLCWRISAIRVQSKYRRLPSLPLCRGDEESERRYAKREAGGRIEHHNHPALSCN